MSRIIFDNEYVIVIPTFKETVSHKHDFYHIFFLRSHEIFVTGSGMKHTMPSPDECYAFLMIDPTSDLADHLKERVLVEGSPVRSKVTATFAYSEAFDDEIIKERVSEWLRDAGFSDKKPKDEVEDYRIIKLIQEIKDYKHLEENIAQIALRYNLSESRLSHAFKENVGISLKGYLTIARLKYAYRLVMEGKSKTYASYEAGFSSPAHLAYICKKQMGISITDVLR